MMKRAGTCVFGVLVGFGLFSSTAHAGDLIVHAGGSLIVHSNVTVTAGTLTIESGGTIDMDLGSQITATNFVFGGTVNVVEADAVLGNGSSWNLFVGPVYGGSFVTVTLPALAVGLMWDQTELDAAGTLSIDLATPPGIQSITQVGSDYIVTGASGYLGGGYSVLKSIDVTLPIAEWVEVENGTFGPAGEFSVALPISGIEPIAFYLIRIP